MVKVENDNQLQQSLRRPRRQVGVWDGKLLVEKYIERGRYIEVQIADAHGNVIHL